LVVKKQNYRVAIDVGASKVATLIVGLNDENERNFDVVGFAVARYRAEDDDGHIARERALSQSVAAAESQAKVKIKRAYACLTTKRVKSFQKTDSVFAGREMTTITDGEIRQALKMASSVQTEGDEEVLHIIPHKYYLDEKQVVKNPLGMHSSELSIECQIITAARQDVTELKELLRKANITLEKAVVSQLAAAEVAKPPGATTDDFAAIDIGYASTGIAVFEQGELAHISSLPVGGRNATRDLAVSLALSLEDAEALKIEHGSCNPNAQKRGDEVEIHPQGLEESVQIPKRDIAEIVKTRYQEICQLILHRLNEPDIKHTQVESLVFSGGGALTDGFGALARYVTAHKARFVEFQNAALTSVDGLAEAPNAVVIGTILWSNRNIGLASPQVGDATSGTGETDPVVAAQSPLSALLKRLVAKFFSLTGR